MGMSQTLPYPGLLSPRDPILQPSEREQAASRMAEGRHNTFPGKVSPLTPALLTTRLSYPGCGKTYTMLGTDHEPGIYVRTLNDLFRAIEETSNDMEYEVSMSYLEASPQQASVGGTYDSVVHLHRAGHWRFLGCSAWLSHTPHV